MAIGTITSPATWVIGTVAAPAWFQNVQDNINSWINGTGATFASLQIDGTGNATSNAPQGVLLTKHSEYHENWHSVAGGISITTRPLTNLSQRWGFTMTGTTQHCTFQDPSSTYPQRSVLLNAGTNGTGEKCYLSTMFPVSYPNGSLTLLFDATINTSSGNAQELHFGLSTDIDATNTAGPAFYKDYTTANWQCVVSATNHDSGVAPTIGTYQRFRIDITSGNAVVFYINGTQVYTSSLTPALYYVGFGSRTPNAGASTYTIGDVAWFFTRY